jgi:hypothetical protein
MFRNLTSSATIDKTRNCLWNVASGPACTYGNHGSPCPYPYHAGVALITMHDLTRRLKVDTAHLSIQPAPHLQTISGMVGGGSGPFSIFLLDSRAIASNNQQCATPIHPAPPHPRLSRETRACLSQSGLFGPFFSSGWQWEPRSPRSASPEPPVPGGFSVNKFSAKTALNSTFEKFAEPNGGQFVMQKYSGCDP